MSQSPTKTVPHDPTGTSRKRHDVIVIGAGQAGLAVGYYLQRRKVDFVILDAGERVGDPWRQRWDSLRLFSPAKLDGLPGMRFPAPGHTHPPRTSRTQPDVIAVAAGQ